MISSSEISEKISSIPKISPLKLKELSQDYRIFKNREERDDYFFSFSVHKNDSIDSKYEKITEKFTNYFTNFESWLKNNPSIKHETKNISVLVILDDGLEYNEEFYSELSTSFKCFVIKTFVSLCSWNSI